MYGYPILNKIVTIIYNLTSCIIIWSHRVDMFNQVAPCHVISKTMHCIDKIDTISYLSLFIYIRKSFCKMCKKEHDPCKCTGPLASYITKYYQINKFLGTVNTTQKLDLMLQTATLQHLALPPSTNSWCFPP